VPGLIRGVARTAVVAGTASAVAGRVNRHQQNKWAAQDQQQYNEQQDAYQQQAPQQAVAPAAPVAAPAAGSTDDTLEQLQKLGQLKEAGVLTDAEFAAEKAKILG
jgi:hypothetical protein